jgi:hypothetical protein
MATPTKRKHSPRRNAKPKKGHSRFRNAAPPAGRLGRAPAPKPKEPLTFSETLVQLGETLGGAALTSVIGAAAVRWGLHPEMVSLGLGAAGVYAATSKKDLVRNAGAGAASAAGSQYLLLKFTPAPTAKLVAQTPTPALPAPTHTVQLPQRKNADLGTLPPGMLDAAFERARAELAVGDSYAYEHHHEHHHQQ